MNGDLLRTLPDHVLTTKVFTYFGFKDYALTSCASTYLQAHWQTANQNKPLPLHVPEDCRTLKEAVKRVGQDYRITTLVLGKGEHWIDNEDLQISFAMNIFGRQDVPKEKIVVMGGIEFKKGIQGNCHLQHLTLRQAKRYGVHGCSSFTMEDVLVEQCGRSGVVASGTGGVGRCTNVQVQQCERSGVSASKGGSITLIGAKTSVHHNCTTGKSDEYGLVVYGVSATIQLVSPLTKEIVSIHNRVGHDEMARMRDMANPSSSTRGGDAFDRARSRRFVLDELATSAMSFNWGVHGGANLNQIKTIDAPVISSTASAPAAVPVGETKSNHH